MTKQKTENQSEDWQYLFDGTNLDQWETYLGPPFKPGVEWVDALSDRAIGRNKDPHEVFQISQLDKEAVLRISGEIWGSLTTKESFENYHLQLQFKWGEKKWFPREHKKRDSGLLYHSQGKFGDSALFWLPSQEFQIQEGDVGDYWGIGGATSDIPAIVYEPEVYQYNTEGELQEFGLRSDLGRRCKKLLDAESSYGEWSTIDLYCYQDEAMHVVNGQLNMRIQNSRLFQKGKYKKLSEGKIQLQSEAAEIYYREIKIRGISELPPLT